MVRWEVRRTLRMIIAPTSDGMPQIPIFAHCLASAVLVALERERYFVSRKAMFRLH